MRENDPVAAMGHDRTFRGSHLDGAALGHDVGVLSEPHPQRPPVLGVVRRRDAQGGPVVEVRMGTTGSHGFRSLAAEPQIRPCFGDQKLNLLTIVAPARTISGTAAALPSGAAVESSAASIRAAVPQNQARESSNNPPDTPQDAECDAKSRSGGQRATSPSGAEGRRGNLMRRGGHT